MGGIVNLAATCQGTTSIKVDLKVLLRMWGRRYNVYDLYNYHLIFSINDVDVEGIQVRHPWQGPGLAHGRYMQHSMTIPVRKWINALAL